MDNGILLFTLPVKHLEDIDGANLHGCHTEILDCREQPRGEHGALRLAILVRDDRECRLILWIERHNTVAERHLIGAVRRLVEEAQCLLRGIADLLRVGDVNLLRGRLDRQLLGAVVDGIDPVKVARTAVGKEDRDRLGRIARNLLAVDAVDATRSAEVKPERAVSALDKRVRLRATAT